MEILGKFMNYIKVSFHSINFPNEQGGEIKPYYQTRFDKPLTHSFHSINFPNEQGVTYPDGTIEIRYGWFPFN